MFSSLFSLITFVASLTLIHAYPGGPPPSACEAMDPGAGHGVQAQSSQSPYSVKASKTTYSPDEKLTIVIDGGEMEGFFLQARLANNTRVGTFVDFPAKQKSFTCTTAGDATTQTEELEDPKPASITSYWTAPKVDVGDVKFVATVVKGKTTFWVKVQSSAIKFAAAAGGGGNAATTTVKSSGGVGSGAATTTAASVKKNKNGAASPSSTAAHLLVSLSLVIAMTRMV